MNHQLLFICASVMVFQIISGQYIGQGVYGNNYYPNAVAAEINYANNMAYGPLASEVIPEVGRSFNGGGLKVTSYSPISPTGVTVESDNLMMEGPLAVSGRLPFSGVVSLEGPLPAAGHGAVAYACGDGNVGIVSETIENGYGPGYANGFGAAGLPGYNGVGNVLNRL
ncbi:chorion class B protein M2410-like [Nymphalis io]|uniref:chorion class B protein M2410-like n=1 Tax=Inachis io TaxID=171585 RepID=UPI002168448C|nr:chorion class B protein M2410-like [Nymphalis io]